ncbi:MAG: hypothetical protein QGE95_12305 [Arenicellales bacterium]|nr:hypothetical protein [Arenicellales bacterium]
MTTKTMPVLTTKPKIIAINGPKGRMELNGHPIRSLKVGRVTKFGVAVKGNLHEIQAVSPMIVTVDLSTDPLVKGRAEYREASKACKKADLAKVRAGKMPKAEAEPEGNWELTARPAAGAGLAKRVEKIESLLETLIENLVNS